MDVAAAQDRQVLCLRLPAIRIFADAAQGGQQIAPALR
jgi:hypothetical protein